MRKPSSALFLVIGLGLSTAACDESESDGDRDAGHDAGADAGSGGRDAAMDGSSSETDAEPGEDASDDGGVDASDGMQAVSIRFKAKVGGQDLACGEHYANLGTTHVTATPQDFRFYVQEVRLVRADATEEKVEFDVKPPFQSKDVALLDFTDGAGACGGSGGIEPNTTITGKVAAGDYEGIVFINGVPEELNHAGPASSARAPLDDATLFWDWLGGYRFIVAELLPVSGGDGDGGAVHDGGTGDAGTDGGQGADGGHSADGGGGHGALEGAFVHIGSTGCSGTPANGISCVRLARNEVHLEGFDPNTNYVIADLGEVFKNSDLQRPPQCHSTGVLCAAPYAALGIDMDSGLPSENQQVFRVE